MCAVADAGRVAHRLELAAVVEGEGQHLRPMPLAVGAPVQALERLVVAQRPLRRAVREEVAELGPGRDRRRAAVPGDREGAAGIGEPAAFLKRQVAQIAAQEAAHEGIAGAQHVVDLDRKARPLDPVLDVVRDGAGERHAAHRPALADDERRRCQLAHLADGIERHRRAAGDVQLLLGADDDVAERQDGLQMRRWSGHSRRSAPRRARGR